MDENLENKDELLYHINPYGERISFFLQGKYSVFRNTIDTPGAISFNKDDFCKDILNIFAANRIVSLRLVVVEGDEYKLSRFNNKTLIKSKSDIKEVIGFGQDEEKTSISPFHFRGIKSNITLEQLQLFILKHSVFSVNNPINSLQFTATNSPDKNKGLGGDKYFSEFAITSKASNRQYFLSSFYTSAKHTNLIDLIKDFETLSAGTVISISRKLSLGSLGFAVNKDLNKIVPYGVTGIGQTRINPPYGAGKHTHPFSLEWIEQEKASTSIQVFIQKYMRIRSKQNTVAVQYARISKTYPIETKENARHVSKRQFADKMRFNPTEAEEALGYLLGTLQLNFHERFKRQITIAGYIADFYSAQFRLAIEVDGKSHLTEKGKETDKQKEIAFFRHSVMTIRVSNEDALYYPDTVKPFVQKAIKKWRSTAIGANPWDMSDEDIVNRIKIFRESLNSDIG